MGSDGVAFEDYALEKERIIDRVFAEDEESGFGVVLFQGVENNGGGNWVWAIVESEGDLAFGLGDSVVC